MSFPSYPKEQLCLEKEGLAKECTWKLGVKQECPHNMQSYNSNKKISDSWLDVVGQTPMIRINNMTKKDGIECEVLVKCEFLNPCGSVKDRIARRMILDAEKTGRIKPGDVLIEPTSGNTGLGLAGAAASKGYKCIIVMLEKMSQEKQDALRGLGAEIVRTPTELPMFHADGIVGTSLKLQKLMKDQGKGAEILNQYNNSANPIAHYMETGQEIWDQCEGKLDYVVMGMGTGGTLTGVSRKLKELNPNIKVVGVDPPGSLLSGPDHFVKPAPGGQVIEGTGYDFIPRVYDQTGADDFMSGPDKESFVMARRLMKEEGLMCGGSSGQAMHAAFQYIKKHKIGAGKRVVVVLPDNIRNYMTKHLNSDWMYERNYITEKECAEINKTDLVPNKDWGKDKLVGNLPLHVAKFITIDKTCEQAMQMMKETGFDQFPVKDENGEIVGVLTDKNLLQRLYKSQLTLNDPIKRAVVRDLRHVSGEMTLDELSRVLSRNSFVLVNNKYFVTISDILDNMRGETKREMNTQATDPMTPAFVRNHSMQATAQESLEHVIQTQTEAPKQAPKEEPKVAAQEAPQVVQQQNSLQPILLLASGLTIGVLSALLYAKHKN